MIVYTIGYGGRAIGDFLELLRQRGVTLLVDTRSLPYSRFRPDYRKKTLQEQLEAVGIAYRWMGEALGGKKVDPACMVDGKIDLERLSALPAFREAMDTVVALARDNSEAGGALALMCAEQRPEACHRSWMLAPQLEARTVEVLHIDENGALKTQQEVRGWFDHA
jgi:uncharacterized protein (DUF488 family)